MLFQEMFDGDLLNMFYNNSENREKVKVMAENLNEYFGFVKEIKELIYKCQYEALKSVNRELINLYWEIGKEITKQQEEKGWGKSVVAVLAQELQREFPGIKGFSIANLWRMRNFYINYCENEKLAPLVREISWTKNVIIMEKCKDDLEREFYIKTTKKYGWTKDVLTNNLDNKAYHKYLTNQTNFDLSVPEKYRLQAKLAVKDEYTFDLKNRMCFYKNLMMLNANRD